MDTTLDELRVLLEAETEDFKSAIDEIKSDVKRLSDDVKSQTDKIKSSFSSMGSFIKKAVVGIGIALTTKFAKQAIDLASDIDEVENVVNVSFGNMRKHVDDFAKSSITQFGMSSLSAKRTASTYMAMSNGMGFTGDAAAKMSVNVAKLTGDVASFYNVSQDVADTALKSIWTGETEALIFSAVA